MKLITFILILITFFPIQGQNRFQKGPKHFGKRFDDLEKIKLLEVLELDEETTLKFFARRNELKRKVDDLLNDQREVLIKLQNLLESDKSDEEYDVLIEKTLNTNTLISKEKNRFIKSLSDILSKEQIAQYILFEKKFRNDIKDLLIERGRKHYFRNRFGEENPSLKEE